jgi:hypothetical protein
MSATGPASGTKAEAAATVLASTSTVVFMLLLLLSVAQADDFKQDAKKLGAREEPQKNRFHILLKSSSTLGLISVGSQQSSNHAGHDQ